MKEYSDIELLQELLRRNKVAEAPWTKVLIGKWVESIIAIGKDNTAYLIMSEEDMIKLEELS